MFVRYAAAAMVAFSVLNAGADVTMSQEQSVQELKKGKPAGEKTVTITSSWIGEDKMYTDNEESSMILRLDKDMMYLIDKKKKTYTEVPLSVLNATADAAADPAVGMPGMIANMVKMEVSVEPTTETKKIGDWNCTKYNQKVTMMGITTTSEMWATEDVKIRTDLFTKSAAAGFLKQQGMKDFAAKMVKEYEKVKGVVVYSVSNTKVMGKESVTTIETKEIKEGAAPAGIYEVPAKYKAKKWQ